MASPSKEENILNIILENSPLKEWHFEEVIREASVTRAVANKWLKKYVGEGLLRKVKKQGSFPFFTVGRNNSVYYSLKRVYALEKLHHSGLIPELLSMEKAKTVIIFGSIARGDWYRDSDIDIFILGDVSDFNRNLYELNLGRQIELHIFRDKNEIKKIKTGLMKNIINGYLVKGNMQVLLAVA
ncbi:nucleotidyltransferase domain-containing protein [Nanoarchaeota archaeon]